jgi:small multidrug resistance pump
MNEPCNNLVGKAPQWMGTWLRLAAVYNILWGGFVIFFPALQFEWLGMDTPRYLGFWQCIGMIVGVYGLGYWWAAKSPYQHWPIVAVGLLGKIFGPIGFLEAILTGKLPLGFGVNIIFNDLIWWPSFFMIMHGAWKNAQKNGEWP